MPPSSRTPGWREVVLIAAAVLIVVFAVEAASLLVPSVGALFGQFPTTIAILAIGTVAILALTALRRPRD